MKQIIKSSYLVVCLLFAFSLYVNPASAVPLLSLTPSSQTGEPGDSVTLDLMIDGLGNFAPISLGDFDIDIAYDATVLTLSGFTLGGFLGDIGLSEALDFSLGDLGGGVVNLAELSLLEPDAATCVLCISPYLDDIQPASFVLARLEFEVSSLTPGGSTIVGIGTVNALGDGFGQPLAVGSTSDAIIRRLENGVPAPGSLVLLLAGLGLIAFRFLWISSHGAVEFD